MYGADGQRLLRRSPHGSATLYLPGHEVTATAGGTATAVRTYDFDGQLVATRTAAGVDFIVSDVDGSVALSMASGTTAGASSRAYEPFGQVRHREGDVDTDRGFIGQVEDASTGLSYLNARYDDPTGGGSSVAM